MRGGVRNLRNPAFATAVGVVALSLAAGVAAWVTDDGTRVAHDPMASAAMRRAVAECPELRQDLIETEMGMSLVRAQRMQAKAMAANRRDPRHCSALIETIDAERRRWFVIVAGVSAS